MPKPFLDSFICFRELQRRSTSANSTVTGSNLDQHPSHQYLQGSLLTHQSSNDDTSKHTKLYLSVIPPPPRSVETILTQHLLLFTFAPHDSTNCASTVVLLLSIPMAEFRLSGHVITLVEFHPLNNATTLVPCVPFNFFY